MQEVVATINKLRTTLLYYLDSLEGDGSTTRKKKSNIQEACDTLIGKYEMLCHSTAVLCSLNTPGTLKHSASQVEPPMGDSQSHFISASEEQVSRRNILCAFYNMVSISASLRDAIANLIKSAYEEEVVARLNINAEGKTFGNLTAMDLAKLLGENCKLGAVMKRYISDHASYGQIVGLRDTLVHHSVMGVLISDAYSLDYKPRVVSRWTPTGGEMALADYARFVYKESVHLINTVCNCISDSAGDCIMSVN